MTPLDEFTVAFTAGWQGLPIPSSASTAYKAAYKAGKSARADHDFYHRDRDDNG